MSKESVVAWDVCVQLRTAQQLPSMRQSHRAKSSAGPAGIAIAKALFFL